MEKFNIKYKKIIERFCNDFDYFCNYLTQNKVKLSKGTGLIGKKACFAINKQMNRSEEYEREGHMQAGYPVINFMYYIAFSYQILDVNQKDGSIVCGEKYGIYQTASSIEKYLLFFTNYLYDGACWGTESV